MLLLLKSLLHLGQKVITLRTLSHLGSFITFRPSTIQIFPALAIKTATMQGRMFKSDGIYLPDEKVLGLWKVGAGNQYLGLRDIK